MRQRIVYLTTTLFLLSPFTTSSVAADAGPIRGASIGSTDQSFRPHGAHQTLGIVMVIAQDQLSKQGVSAADFEATHFSYICSKQASCVWYVGFEGKEYIWNGQHVRQSMTYVIAVNDLTRRAEDAGPRPPAVNGK